MSLNREFDSNAGRARNPEMIPMRNEPENGEPTGGWMLRMNAYIRMSNFGAADAGRDGRVCSEQPGRRLGARPRSRLVKKMKSIVK